MVKVGDKVRVTVDEYPTGCPRGTICTVVQDFGGGCIDATVDSDDGFPWFLTPEKYEFITAEEPDYNYAEQAAKHGITITVELVGGDVVIFDGTK